MWKKTVKLLQTITEIIVKYHALTDIKYTSAKYKIEYHHSCLNFTFKYR